MRGEIDTLFDIATLTDLGLFLLKLHSDMQLASESVHEPISKGISHQGGVTSVSRVGETSRLIERPVLMVARSPEDFLSLDFLLLHDVL